MGHVFKLYITFNYTIKKLNYSSLLLTQQILKIFKVELYEISEKLHFNYGSTAEQGKAWNTAKNVVILFF